MKFPTVIIVDDDTVYSFVMEQRVRAIVPRALIYVETDSIKAAQIAATMRFNFAFIDYMMPRLNGFEIARFFSCHDCKITMITSHDVSRDFMEEGLKAGVQSFIRKPVEESALRAILLGTAAK